MSANNPESLEGAATSRGWVTHGVAMVAYQLRDHRKSDRDRPRLLVVIPCYNAQRWIAGCLAALAKNREPHDILIIEDGGNPLDGIVPAGNMVHCRLKQNIGLIGVLNFAARFALQERYDFYVRQDADDFSAPHRLEMQRALADESSADLVVSGARVVDIEGNPLWNITGRLPADLTSALAVKNIFVHSTWFLRTNVFQRVGCYDERYIGAEDYELLQRIVRSCIIKSVQEPLVDYRVHGDSILGASNRPARTTIRVIAKYFSYRRSASYKGIVRSLAAVTIPRGIKTKARQLIAARR